MAQTVSNEKLVFPSSNLSFSLGGQSEPLMRVLPKIHKGGGRESQKIKNYPQRKTETGKKGDEVRKLKTRVLVQTV